MAQVLTNIGRGLISKRIKGLGTEPNNIGWGTGAGTAAVADTALFVEASEARVAGTSSTLQTTVADDTYRVVGTLTAAAAKTITEVGMFDAATAGNMLMHANFPGVALNANESIQFTIDVQQL